MSELMDVDLILVQVDLRSEELIPRAVRPFVKKTEGPDESGTRQNRNLSGSGWLLLSSSQPANLSFLLKDIKWAGFELVGVFWQKRRDQKCPDKSYITVRATYARQLCHDPYPEFLEAREAIRRGLSGLLAHCPWQRIRVYDNPLFIEGEEVEGRRSLAVNIGGRIDPNQKVWAKTADGERLGTEPQPIQSTVVLRLENEPELLAVEL